MNTQIKKFAGFVSVLGSIFITVNGIFSGVTTFQIGVRLLVWFSVTFIFFKLLEVVMKFGVSSNEE